MTATSPSRIAPPDIEPTHEQWISSLTDIVTVIAWRDEAVEANPNSTPTTSDSSLVTGQFIGLHRLCHRASLEFLRDVRPVDVGG